MSLWLAALVLAAVPESRQLTFPSLPAKLQPLLLAQQKKALQAGAEPLWLVQQVDAGEGQALWVLGGPQPRFCRASGCSVRVYLARGGRFRLVGETRGRLVAVDETVAPPSLQFAEDQAPGQERWRSLLWKGDRYQATPPQERFVDPLTHQAVTAEDLDQAARDEASQGHFAAVAGRLSLLCRAGCTSDQKARLKDAQMKAGLGR
jgi:hypothetical protein